MKKLKIDRKDVMAEILKEISPRHKEVAEKILGVFVERKVNMFDATDILAVVTTAIYSVGINCIDKATHRGNLLQFPPKKPTGTE